MSDAIRPENLVDTKADINPYKLPKIIWEYLERYFERYNVEFTEIFPTKAVERPTIVWAIVKRTPGGGKDQKAQPRGKSFTQFVASDNTGIITEEHTERFVLIIEYTVYGISSANADDIAWDLERAIHESVGLMQTRFPGFTLTFEQQTPDSSMLWRQQDSLIKRTIRFRVDLPLRYNVTKPYIRKVYLEQDLGADRVKKGLFVRTSDSSVYDITNERKVINIAGISLLNSDGEYEQLEYNVDWKLRKNQDGSVSIMWQTEYGRVPSIGQEFFVDYDLAVGTVIDIIQ